MSVELKDQYDKIYRYCYFRVKNAQLAEDLTQETLLKFFSHRTYISRGKPLAYLYTIAKNLCIDTFEKPENVFLEEDIPAKQNFEQLEVSFDLRQAIKALPCDQQEIILLRYANDLSITEISGITGLSRFAVYRKINSTLKKLKHILGGENYFE